MYILQKLNRFVIPRTELTYPSHQLKMHQNAAKAPVDWVGLSIYPNSEFNFGNILLKPAQLDARLIEDARLVFNDLRPITISETGWQVCSTNGCFEND